MMREVSERDFRQWMAYYSLEPFGEERADLRSAIVAATIANCMGGKKGRKYKPKDFMPFSGTTQTPKDHQSIMEGLAAMLTAKKKK